MSRSYKPIARSAGSMAAQSGATRFPTLDANIGGAAKGVYLAVWLCQCADPAPFNLYKFP